MSPSSSDCLSLVGIDLTGLIDFWTTADPLALLFAGDAHCRVRIPVGDYRTWYWVARRQDGVRAWIYKSRPTEWQGEIGW